MTGTTKLHPGMSKKEAVRVFIAMRERLAEAEKEIETLRARNKELEFMLQEAKENK